jgi:hypothetical protein
MRANWCVLLVAVSVTPATAAAQGFCTEVQRLSRENARLFDGGGDPAHRAAARNYQNAHAAYCRAAPAGGGRPAPGNIAGFGGAMLGILGMMAGLAAEAEPEGPPPMSAAEIRAEEQRLARLRADADRELAEARRRCETPNPFAGASAVQGCRAPENPFGRGPFWDSQARRECRTIDFGPGGCIPDSTRELLREAAQNPDRRQPGAHRPRTNYSPYVLTVEDFRRLAAGAKFEDVMTGGLDARVLADVNARLREALAAGR